MIKTLCKLGGVSALALAAATMPASAGNSAQDQSILNSISFQTQIAPTTIRVISTDGERWNAIAEDNISFRAQMALDTAGSGFTQDVGIVLGTCAGLSCQDMPYIWKERTLVRDYNGQASLVFPTTLIPVSQADEIAKIPLGDQLISRCNEKLTAAGPVQAHSFTHAVPATFIADTDRHAGTLAAYDPGIQENPDVVPHADFARTSLLNVNVVCETPTNIAGDNNQGGDGEVIIGDAGSPGVQDPGFDDPGFPNDPGDPDFPVEPEVPGDPGLPVDPDFPIGGDPTPPLKITGKLKLHEYANTDKTKPRLAFARFKIWTNKPGMTKWRLNCTGGFQRKGMKLVKKVGFKKYRIVVKRKFNVTKKGTIHCKLRTRSFPGHPIIASASRFYNVVQPNPGIGDELADGGGAPLKLHGVLDLREYQNTDKTKPRPAYAKFAILTNKPGKTSWKVKCTNGAQFSGKTTLKKLAAHSYRARISRSFFIDKTRNVKCQLRSITANKHLATDKRLYKVANGGQNPGNGGGGLVGKKVSGKIALKEGFGFKLKKPRKIRAGFSIRTRKPGPVKWRISCTGGRNFAGTASMKKIGFLKYRGKGLVRIKVSKTETMKCVLRSVTHGQKFLAKSTRKFVVRKKQNLAGGGGLLNPKKPIIDKDVINKRPIVGSIRPRCIGGRVISTKRLPAQHKCLCPRNKNRRKLGRHVFKCVPKFAKLKKPRKFVERPKAKRKPGKFVKRPKALKKPGKFVQRPKTQRKVKRKIIRKRVTQKHLRQQKRALRIRKKVTN